MSDSIETSEREARPYIASSKPANPKYSNEILQRIEKHVCMPHKGWDMVDPFELIRACVKYAGIAQADQQLEPCRPDLLENLTYHASECDDMTLNDVLDVLANGWKKVHGRTERQFLLQLVRLMASAPEQANLEEVVPA